MWISHALVRIEGLCMMIDSLHTMATAKVTVENVDELAERLCEETFNTRLELLKAHDPKSRKWVENDGGVSRKTVEARIKEVGDARRPLALYDIVRGGQERDRWK